MLSAATGVRVASTSSTSSADTLTDGDSDDVNNDDSDDNDNNNGPASRCGGEAGVLMVRSDSSSG
jgi:hypothetical protein